MCSCLVECLHDLIMNGSYGVHSLVELLSFRKRSPIRFVKTTSLLLIIWMSCSMYCSSNSIIGCDNLRCDNGIDTCVKLSIWFDIRPQFYYFQIINIVILFNQLHLLPQWIIWLNTLIHIFNGFKNLQS